MLQVYTPIPHHTTKEYICQDNRGKTQEHKETRLSILTRTRMYAPVTPHVWQVVKGRGMGGQRLEVCISTPVKFYSILKIPNVEANKISFKKSNVVLTLASSYWPLECP